MFNLKLMEQQYICPHCSSKFMKEKTLIVHMCEQKRRHLARNEKHVQVAFQAYNRFYQLVQKQDKPKEYDDFARSPYYNAFIKFGSFVHNVNPLYPDQYIDYVVKSGVKLDHWCRDGLYEQYVLYLVKTEPVEVALQRSIGHMMDWDIKDGKVSPWLVLNCASGKKLLTNFNDEQLSAIGATIDPEFWRKKFAKHPDDVELVKQVVKESNL